MLAADVGKLAADLTFPLVNERSAANYSTLNRFFHREQKFRGFGIKNAARDLNKSFATSKSFCEWILRKK